VTREQILADMAARHPDHPRLRTGGLQRVIGMMPSTRRMSRPWKVVLDGGRPLLERNRAAFADVLAMGSAAARQALDAYGIAAERVDCVITSHSTGDAVPGLDAHLVRDLGLRPDVSRRPMTQLGCGGGAHGLVQAADFVRARPGSVVLLVVAESLSSIYHHSDTAVEMMIYKALWGDSGTAVLVTDRPLGPGLAVHDTWEYLLPGTVDRYRKRLDLEGVHFDSDKSATLSVDEMAPALLKWLASPLPGVVGDGPVAASGSGSAAAAGVGGAGLWPLAFTVSHTGGPAILDDLAKQLSLSPGSDGALRHSWESLDQVGNLGGASVLDVLARHHGTPPAVGDAGLLLGFGPGFSVSALKATWTDGA
jgi:predicted naringenin-chalcone synthase